MCAKYSIEITLNGYAKDEKKTPQIFIYGNHVQDSLHTLFCNFQD